jgi:TonB family protein
MVRVKVALFLPVLLAACSSRGGDPYEHLGSPRQAIEGVVGRVCYYLTDPPAPASVDALARPGTRGSILLWGRGAAATDTVDVSIRYGRDGKLVWVRAIRDAGQPGRVAELEQILEAGLEEDGPADWGVRVRLVGGLVDQVLPSVSCPAERGPPVGRVATPAVTMVDRQQAAQAAGRELEVEVGLDAEGRVVGVRLMQGSGSRLLDQYAVDLARAYRYEPRLHDGVGVPSTIQLRFSVPRR